MIFGLTVHTGLSAQAAKPTVATIGSKKYTNLNNAFKSVKRGQTIKLRRNITVTKTINLNKNLPYTIDFNKKNITYKGKEDTALFNIQKGNIKIKNINVTANKLRGVMEISKKASVSIMGGAARGYWINQGKLTLNKVRMRANYGKPFQTLIKNYGTSSISNCNAVFTGVGNVLYNASKGKATISGGSYQVVKADMEGTNYPIIYNEGRMTIKKGTFSRKEDQYVIWNREKGNLTIKGGRFVGKAVGKDNELGYATAVVANEGTASISGGEFLGNCQMALVTMGTKKLKITGGSFTSKKNPGAFLQGTTNISGGKFKGGKGWFGSENKYDYDSTQIPFSPIDESIDCAIALGRRCLIFNGVEIGGEKESWKILYTEKDKLNGRGAEYTGNIICLYYNN